MQRKRQHRVSAVVALVVTLLGAGAALAARPASAAASRTLGGAQDQALRFAGVSHPAATPGARASKLIAPDGLREEPRRHVVDRGAQPRIAAGPSHRVDAASVVAPAASGGVSQLQTVQGMTRDSQGIAISPPDTNVSASSSMVVEAVNLSLLRMNHDGSNQQVVHLSDLWSSLTNGGTYDLSDPRIQWDASSSRWFTSIVVYDPALFTSASAASHAHSWIGLAVSTDATPVTWTVYSLQSASGVLLDQPGLGVNGDKVTTAANTFDYSQLDSGGNPLSTGAFVAAASKADMLAAVSNASLHATGLQICYAFGIAPATAPTSATTAYGVFNFNPIYGLPPGCAGAPGGQTVSVVTITGVPSASTSASFAEQDLAMPFVTGPPNAIPQPSSSVTVDPGDDRFLSAVWQGNRLWTGGSAATVNSATSQLALFGVDTTNASYTLPTALTIFNSAGEALAFPGIAVDSGGNPTIGFSRGSSARYMSAGALAYTPSSDAVHSAGVLSGGAGQGVYSCHCTGTAPTRWGDYSGAAVDPSDPTTVWVAAEYSAVGDGHDNNWATVLTRVTLQGPQATSSSPGSGLTRGGTWVTVQGNDFDEASSVSFGGVAAQAVVQQGQQQLAALTPPHRAGQVDVTVSTPAGSVTLPGAFTYQLPPRSGGYWMVASDGGMFPFGNAGGFGSVPDDQNHGRFGPLNQPIVGMAATPDGGGYWLVASDGGIFPYGDAVGRGSTGGMHLNQPIVGMAATPSGQGYWLVAKDGGIFPFGDAGGFGSHGGSPLNQPIVGMAATPTGRGYWLVASDGGIFPYGDAGGWGSHGGSPLNQPIVGMAATSDGGGYWLVASDGGIFPYGDAAQGLGSTGNVHLNQPMVGMAQSGDDGGYWLVASDGGIFPFGDARQGLGSTGNIRLNQPIVGMAPSQP